METIIIIYILATFIFSTIEAIIWAEKLCDYFTYKNIKFKYLIKVHDLGLIIFPFAIPLVLLVLIIATVDELLENAKPNLLGKNIFK